MAFCILINKTNRWCGGVPDGNYDCEHLLAHTITIHVYVYTCTVRHIYGTVLQRADMLYETCLVPPTNKPPVGVGHQFAHLRLACVSNVFIFPSLSFSLSLFSSLALLFEEVCAPARLLARLRVQRGRGRKGGKLEHLTA